jgi:hypothetical protein
MGLTYEWKLTGLKKQSSINLEDAVVGTSWKVIGTDTDGNQGSFTGATPFSISTINTGSFTAYSELTEVQVIDWVKAHVSGSSVSTNYWGHINEVIQKEINGKKWVKVEISETDLPWSPTSGSITPSVPEVAPI